MTTIAKIYYNYIEYALYPTKKFREQQQGGNYMSNKKGRMSTKTLVLASILTALVFILQYMGSFIRLGMFSVSLVLIPIVIGTATCGAGVGAWLGLVFGVAVLASGDAAGFYAVNPLGTIITVLLKGIACGGIAGIVYQLIARKNRIAGVIASAIACPVVNSGIFLIGCFLFFLETIVGWAGGQELGYYIIFGLGLINFPVELAINLVLSPVIVRLIEIGTKQK